MAVMGAPTLTVEAVPPRRSGFTLWRVVLFLLTRGVSEISASHYPSVVVRNEKGQEFRLFGAANWDEAIAKRDRLRHELAEMDQEAWCDRYRVPDDFVRGRWPPSPPS